ncbi:MAG: hypothetical protein HC905_12345, partial [Bacteroidales bacterium]|nr:hypothetical protein [Bacteroidales bacterium]
IGELISDNYIEYARLKMTMADSEKYSFQYRLPGSENSFSAEVNKIGGYNQVYFSFAENKQGNPEPPADSFDLVFTPYYDLLFDDNGTPVPYFLRGVFINQSRVKAYLETGIPYEEFGYSNILSEKFSSKKTS